MEAKTASAEVGTASKVTVKVSGETSNGLEIPETLNDINSEWILNLVRRTSKEESLTLTHLNITTELNDGFYDSCCVSVRSSNGARFDAFHPNISLSLPIIRLANFKENDF